MHQVQHLTLVNFALYSSQLETSLLILCIRAQLQSLHLTSVTLAHGAIGFLLQLCRKAADSPSRTLSLKRLRLDAIKLFTSSIDYIRLIDVEHAELIDDSSLEHVVWRE